MLPTIFASISLLLSVFMFRCGSAHYTEHDEGDPMLYFKLPATISSPRAGAHIEAPLLPEYLADDEFKSPLRGGATYPEDERQEGYMESSSDNKEQSISLTIPLSTLNLNSFMNAQKEQNRLPQQASTRYVKIIEPDQRLSPAEYPTMRPRRNTVTLQDAELSQIRTSQRPQTYSVLNLTQYPPANDQFKQILLQEQIQQLLNQLQKQQQQPQNLYQQPSLDLYPMEAPQQPQQPQLWRNSQPNIYQNHSTSSTNFLNKLSNSSPDLLIRLRNLLQKSSKMSLESDTSSYGLNSSSSMGVRMIDLSSGNRNQMSGDSRYPLDSIEQYKSQMTDRSMLNTFLHDKNISSHEEIKFPFIVIAMPRIMSLRRNQVSNSGSRMNATSLSQASLMSLLQQALMGPKNYSASSNSTGNQSVQLARIGRYQNSNTSRSNHNSTSNSMSPTFIYLTNENQNAAPRDQRSSNSGTSPTAAPYAHPFSQIDSMKQSQQRSGPYGSARNMTGNSWLAVNQASTHPQFDDQPDSRPTLAADQNDYNRAQVNQQRQAIRVQPAYELGRASSLLLQHRHIEPEGSQLVPTFNAPTPLESDLRFPGAFRSTIFGGQMREASDKLHSLPQIEPPFGYSQQSSQAIELLQRLQDRFDDQTHISNSNAPDKKPKMLLMLVDGSK